MNLMATIVLLTSVAIAERSHNLLYNGSFEVGLCGWACYVRGTPTYTEDSEIVFLDPRPIRSTKEAAHGRYCWSFAPPKHAIFTLASRAYELKPGLYQLSGLVRCLPGSPPAKFGLGDANQRNKWLFYKTVNPAREWQQVVISADLTKFEKPCVLVMFSGAGAGRYALDDVKLIAKNNIKSYPAEIGLEALEPDHIYFASQPKLVIVRWFARNAQLKNCMLRWQVQDAWGKVVLHGQFRIKLNQSKIMELKLPDTGHYRLLAQAYLKRKVISAPAELLLAVVPDRKLADENTPGEDSPFGINMVARPHYIKVAQKIGIRWVRCNPPLFTKWFCAEPQQDKFKFYDAQCQALRSAGLYILGTLDQAPKWAVPADRRGKGAWGQGAGLPEKMEDWDDYVRTVVKHYRPWIWHWEVWNEPDHPAFLWLPEGVDRLQVYKDLLQRTYEVIKQTDHSVKVVGGAFCSLYIIKGLVEITNGKFMDIASGHYRSWTPTGYLRLSGEEMNWLARINRDRQELSQKSLLLPMWDTECGSGKLSAREFITQPPLPGDTMTALDACDFLLRQHVVERAAGVEKTFYYILQAADRPDFIDADYTLLEWDRSPRAALVVYAVMTKLLDKAKFVEYERTKEGVWIFHFHINTTHLRIVWGEKDTPIEVLLPAAKNVTVLDMFGVKQKVTRKNDYVLLSIGRHPLYLLEKS